MFPAQHGRRLPVRAPTNTRREELKLDSVGVACPSRTGLFEALTGYLLPFGTKTA